jgi:hypothetical protein
MPILRIHHAVPSFATWKRALDSAPVDRRGGRVRRYLSNEHGRCAEVARGAVATAGPGAAADAGAGAGRESLRRPWSRHWSK